MIINSIANFTAFSSNFNATEQRAIDTVRDYSRKYGVETAQIIKNGTNITDEFTLSETSDAVMVSMPNEFDKIFDAKGLSKIKAIINTIKAMVKFKSSLKNSVYIHSHTTEMPLSPSDIYTGAKFGVEKMVAVTPSGKISVMEGLNKTDIQKGLPVFDEQISTGMELREKYGENYMNIPEAFKIIQNGEIEAIDEFVKKTGVQYESDIVAI